MPKNKDSDEGTSSAPPRDKPAIAFEAADPKEKPKNAGSPLKTEDVPPPFSAIRHHQERGSTAGRGAPAGKPRSPPSGRCSPLKQHGYRPANEQQRTTRQGESMSVLRQARLKLQAEIHSLERQHGILLKLEQDELHALERQTLELLENRTPRLYDHEPKNPWHFLYTDRQDAGEDIAVVGGAKKSVEEDENSNKTEPPSGVGDEDADKKRSSTFTSTPEARLPTTPPTTPQRQDRRFGVVTPGTTPDKEDDDETTVVMASPRRQQEEARKDSRSKNRIVWLESRVKLQEQALEDAKRKIGKYKQELGKERQANAVLVDVIRELEKKLKRTQHHSSSN